MTALAERVTSWRKDSPTDLIPTAALTILGVLFAFESRTPLLVVGNTFVLTSVEVLIVLALATWVVTLLRSRRRPSAPLMVIVPAISWIAALLASTATAPAPIALPLRFTARMVAGVALAWACYDCVVTARRPVWIACGLALGGGLVAVLGLAEALNLPVIVTWLGNFKVAPTRVGDILRISSTLSYATIASMVLELTFPLALGWFITAKHSALKAAAGVIGLLDLIVLVLTLSRAGVIALGAALAVVVLAALRSEQRRIAYAGAGAMATLGILAGLSIVYNPEVGLRLTSESDQTWFKDSIAVPGQLTARPGEVLVIPVTVTNASVKTWGGDASHPFSLGYHLYGSDHELVTYDGARTPLGADLPPDGTVQLQAKVVVPDKPDTYDIQWDVVQNGLAWFSWKGAATPSTALVVSGAAANGPAIVYVPPPQSILTLPVPGRLELWSAGLTMLESRPLLGVGPDNFRWQFGPYEHISQWNVDIHANNLYVELLADTGIIGFLAFMWLAWRIIRQSTGGLWTRRSGDLWVWRVAVLASLTAWFVHGLLDYFFEFTPTYTAFWMIVGLALGLAQLEVNERLDANANADRV